MTSAQSAYNMAHQIPSYEQVTTSPHSDRVLELGEDAPPYVASRTADPNYDDIMIVAVPTHIVEGVKSGTLPSIDDLAGRTPSSSRLGSRFKRFMETQRGRNISFVRMPRREYDCYWRRDESGKYAGSKEEWCQEKFGWLKVRVEDSDMQTLGRLNVSATCPDGMWMKVWFFQEYILICYDRSTNVMVWSSGSRLIKGAVGPTSQDMEVCRACLALRPCESCEIRA